MTIIIMIRMIMRIIIMTIIITKHVLIRGTMEKLR